jgi:protein gp37
MAESAIEWTEMTWNPTTGCNKISAGCKFCYAEIMARRLKAMGLEKYRNGFRLTLHRDALQLPYSWKHPKLVFVNSMSDLFHSAIPVEFLKEVFSVMNDCPRHTFQVLTKRADILVERDPFLTWTPNIWMGVSVENGNVLSRIDYLRETRAVIKFLSLEPLLGPLPNLNLKGIDWVIVGGESGPHARPIAKEWVEDIRDQCHSSGVKFFFKQWGGKRKKVTGRQLNGRFYNDMPARSQVA